MKGILDNTEDFILGLISSNQKNNLNHRALLEKVRGFDQKQLSILLRSPEHNKFFDFFKIDWIYKGFPYPSILLNDNPDILQKAICKEITNPKEATKYYLSKLLPEVDVFSNLFYQRVFKNPFIFENSKMEVVHILLEVADNIEKTLHLIEEPFHRFIYDVHFRVFVLNCFQASIKIDFFKSNQKYPYKLETNSVKYKGVLNLPESCTIITEKTELAKEGKNMKHCISHNWESIAMRKEFVIHMEFPEKTTFLIQPFENTDWFMISKAKGVKNKEPEINALKPMFSALLEEQNQEFFRRNSSCKKSVKKFITWNVELNMEEIVQML
ncbi:MAG: hypothetical protein AB7S69_11740 [Salinivirgaceae bacterium]